MIIESLGEFVKRLVRVDTEPYDIALEKHPLRVGPLRQKIEDLTIKAKGVGTSIEEDIELGKALIEAVRIRVGDIRRSRRLVILNGMQIPFPPKYSPMPR